MKSKDKKTTMVMSLPVKRSLQRMRLTLGVATASLIAISALMGFLMEGRPWASVILGLAAGLVMFGVSMFTTTKSANSESGNIGWVALDYVTKIAVVGSALFWAESSDFLNLRAVGILVIAAVGLNLMAQLLAFITPASGSSNHTE